MPDTFIAFAHTDKIQKEAFPDTYPWKVGTEVVEDVMFCQHCRKMSLAYQGIKTNDGKIVTDLFTSSEISMLMKCIQESFFNPPPFSASIIVKTIAGLNDLYYRKEKKQRDLSLNKLIFELEKLEGANPNANLQYDALKRKLDEVRFIPELTCPACGKKIYKKNIRRLKRERCWMKNPYYYAYDGCGIKEDEEKIYLNAFLKAHFPATEHGVIKVEKVHIRFVFNKDTKNVYALQACNATTGKPMEKGKKPITNITYLTSEMNHLEGFQKMALNNEEAIGKMAGYICKSLGRHGDLYEEFGVVDGMDKLLMKDVILLFRYPKYKADTRKAINKLTECPFLGKSSAQKRKVLLQQVYLMQQDIGVMYTEMKKKKVPMKKKVKKLIAENPLIIYMYRLLTSVGFSDYNIILSIILSNPCFRYFLMDTYCSAFTSKETAGEVKELLKFYTSSTTEALAKKYLFEVPDGMFTYQFIGELTDTAHMYHQIREDGWQDIPCQKAVTLHDTLSRLMPKIQKTNKKIPYKEKDLRVNMEVKGYRFVLAPDTYSLIDCGEALGICVGGYADFVMGMTILIVFVLKGGCFCGCIEFSRATRKLIQAKTKFNNMMCGALADATKEWIKENKINAEGCKDYKRMGIQDGRDFNYATNTRGKVATGISFQEEEYKIIQ